MRNTLTTSNTLSTNTLKVWAIVAMVCDHAPYLLENWQELYYTWPWTLMHSFGRLTAPIFFYLVALGYRRTRNANRYTARLLAFALISYVPFIWYFRGAAPMTVDFLDKSMELNVIFTMLFGLLLLRTVHEVNNNALKALLVVLCLVGGYWCDYGLYGLALILVCDAARGSRRGTVLGMGAVIMAYVYVRTSSWMAGGLALPGSLKALFDPSSTMFAVFVLLLCQLIPLIFVARHRAWAVGNPMERRPGFWGKWGFYIFYPAHITALLLIRMLAFA